MLIDKLRNTKAYPTMEEQIQDMLNAKRDIYIFGGIIEGRHGLSNGGYVRQVLDKMGIEIAGYIAHKKFITTNTFHGKKVLAIENHGLSAANVSVVIGMEVFDFAKSELQKYGFRHFYFFDACSESLCEGISGEFVESNKEAFERTYNLLYDERSRESMEAYLQAKVYHNFAGLARTQDKNVYFNDLFFAHSRKDGEGEVMIDCGAYDGDSALAFIKACPKYKKVYALEPDRKNIEALIKNTKNERVVAVAKGTWSKKEILCFEASGDMATHISSNGEIEIPVDSIDNILLEYGGGQITFIKMDIEGAELEALKGAENTIRKHKPKLGICVYHKKEDLIEIPQYLDSLKLGYRFYLRNMNAIPTDLVLYALAH